MTKEEVVGALMLFSAVAKWELNPDADPFDFKYDDIIWKDLFFDKPSEEQLNAIIARIKSGANTDYQMIRREAYPNIEQQLDYIFHNGIEEWKEKIQAVKDKYPKP